MKYLVSPIGLVFFFNLCFLELSAQVSMEKDSLPTDAGIRHGKLENGLSYYIKPLENCKTLQLSLFVKAGSNQQDSDQLDAAHAVEHIAFKPTPNFPKSIMDQDLLNKFGMQIYDLKGFSGIYTEYIFNSPNDRAETIDTAFRWFQDIAKGLNFSEQNVNKVRGEIRQEFLEKVNTNMEALAAKSKMGSSLFPGGEDIENYLKANKTFTPDVLQRFYKDWYRPGLMGISVIGNVKDTDAMEKMISKRFAGLKSPKNVPEYKDFTSQYLARPNQFVKIIRKNDSLSLFQPLKTYLIFRNQQLNNNSTLQGLKKEKIYGIFSDLLNKRFDEIKQTYKDSFKITANFSYKTSQWPRIPGIVIEIDSDGNLEKKEIQKAIRIIDQVKLYGATKREWENIIADQKVPLEDTDYWFNQIDKNFNYAELLLNKKDEKLNQWLRHIDRENFNEMIRKIFTLIPQDIGIISPKNSVSQTYSEDHIKQWITEAENDDIVPYRPVTNISNLFDQKDIASLKEKVIEKVTFDKAGKIITLANGLKVVLKPFVASTGSKTIAIKGYCPYGASCFSKEDYYSAVNAFGIVKNSGFGKLDKFEIKRFLLNTGLQEPTGYVDYNESAILGKADSLRDLETLLQMIYMYFTYPRKDELAFKDWQKQKYRQYFSPLNSELINDDFSNDIREATGDPRISGDNIFGSKELRGSKAYLGIKKTNYIKAYDIYNQLFGQASNFTFLVTGNFSEKSVLPLLQKYLGNLPNNNNLNCSVNPEKKYKSLKGPIYQEFSSKNRYKIKGAHYYLCFVKGNVNPEDWKERIKVYALGWLAYQEVIKLRFQKGYSIYDFGGFGDYNKNLNRYEISIGLYMPKNELESLRIECKKIFENIKSGNIEESSFSASTHRLYRNYSKNWTLTQRVMLGKLYDHYRFGLPYIDPQEVEDYVKSLTLTDLIETAKKYCKISNRIEMVLRN